jgi:hypothetical protein
MPNKTRQDKESNNQEEDFADFKSQQVEKPKNGMDEVRASMCEPKPNHGTNNVRDLPAHGWSRKRK